MNEYETQGSNVFYDFYSFKEFALENCNAPVFKCVLKFTNIEEFEAVFEVAFIVKNLMLVVEEIHNFGSANYMCTDLERIIRLGRHANISLVGISQRLYDMAPLMRNNCDAIVCFSLTAPGDLEYLSKIPWIGDEKADQVGQLPKFEHLIFSHDPAFST